MTQRGVIGSQARHWVQVPITPPERDFFHVLVPIEKFAEIVAQ